MPAYRARAEFRRWTRDSKWVLAGIWIGGRFHPAGYGVEAVRGRLPEPGLVGWVPLDSPIVARDTPSAAETALELARAGWPDRARGDVPYPGGVADR